MAETIRAKLRRISEQLGFERDWYLIVLGAIIGTLTGLGAVAFMEGLTFAEHFTRERQGRLSIWLLPLIPMGGALLTGVLVHFFAAEARGHGVPQVMRALIQKRGVIPLRVGLVKVVASIFTVGSGGSAGAEGPIIQIGSTAGSVSGQTLRVARDQMGTLVGCGAAAGIASVFNAPIAGVMFVLEIILRDFSIKTIMPIVIAAVFSTAVTQAIRIEEGETSNALFAAQEILRGYEFQIEELPSYIVLGAICGIAAVAYSRLLHKGEDLYDRVRLHPIIKPVTGALLLGLLGVAYLLIAGVDQHGEHASVPRFFGNGYETIRELINPASYGAGEGATPFGGSFAQIFVLLAVLAACKLVGTVLTLASGGSGGVFAPSLFIGATVGGAVGIALKQIGLIPEAGSPAPYALVGMAAVVAASTHAPVTAIIMLLELTRDPFALLPIMLAAVIATVISQRIEPDSIYTFKLRRAGLRIGRARDLTVMRRVPVATCRVTPLPPEPVYPSDPLSKLITLHAYHSVPDFVVVDQEGAYMGMVTGADMRAALIDREAIPLLLVAELVRDDLPTINSGEMLDTVLDKFAQYDVSSLALTDERDPSRPIGLMTRSHVLERYQDALDEG